MGKFYKSLFLSKFVYVYLGVAFVLFILAYFFPILSIVPRILLLLLAFLLVLDILILYVGGRKVAATRTAPERLSNGDLNEITLSVSNLYNLPIQLRIIEELPMSFQKRDFEIKKNFKPFEERVFRYQLKPVLRGNYGFGNTIVLATSPLLLIMRRYEFDTNQIVPCFPGFKKINQHGIKAIALNTGQTGSREVRKLGQSSEFEQIKEYVKGDDIRKINWRASARKNQLMVNNYIDERSQQIFCIINKGRVMQMPFEGMTLLDYSINASLILTHIALTKNDKAGLITFNNNISTFIKPDSKRTQLNLVLNTLYKEETNFLESDFEKLYSVVKQRITHRSLLVLFTNFETESALERELPYLKKLAQNHLLLVVFFENTEIKKLIENEAENLEQIYNKTIAEKFNYEKRKMVIELSNNGILAILTTPQRLTVDAVNKYIEVKAKRAI